MKHLVWFSLLISVVGCGTATHDGTGKSSSGGQQSASTAAQAAFRDTFYAFAKTQNCVKCHASLITPKFGAADLAEAYAQARGTEIGSTKPLIDFSNPNASIFAIYAGNGHCSDTPCSNPSNTATVQTLLATWATAELAGGPGVTPPPEAIPPKHVSVSIPLPATIAAFNAAQPTLIRFNLNTLSPLFGNVKVANALLEIEVRLANAAGTQYRFSRPKIFGNTATVSVVGLHLYIKAPAAVGMGDEDLSQSILWNAVGKPTPVVAAIAVRPAVLPLTPNAAIPLTTNSIFYPKTVGVSDTLTIGFEDLQ